MNDVIVHTCAYESRKNGKVDINIYFTLLDQANTLNRGIFLICWIARKFKKLFHLVDNKVV